MQMVSKQLAEQPALHDTRFSFLSCCFTARLSVLSRYIHVQSAFYDKMSQQKSSIQQMSAHYWC